MAKEIEALEANENWKVTELPPGKKPINYKWVYRVKYNSDSSIQGKTCYSRRLTVRRL